MRIHMTTTETVTFLGRAGRNLKTDMYPACIVYLLLCNQQRLVNNMYLDISRTIVARSQRKERDEREKERKRERKYKVQNI